MSEGLLRFVFNTLLTRLNNPGHKLWLPTQLEKMTDSTGQRILPLRPGAWQVGDLRGSSGEAVREPFITRFTTYFQFHARKTQPPEFDPPVNATEFEVVPAPDAQAPRLDTTDIEVRGLQNAWVRPGPEVTAAGGGYHLRLTVQFGHYTDKEPVAVDVAGKYALRQRIAIADEGKKTPTERKVKTSLFSWPVHDIVGNGSFVMEIKGLWADIDCDVDPGPDGRLAVTVRHIETRGEQSGQPPGFSLLRDKLTIDMNLPEGAKKDWLDTAQKAFDTPDARAEFDQKLRETLNQADNLGRLGKTFGDLLNDRLEGSLGKATGTAKSVDDNLFDRVRHAVNDEQSPWYLPVGVFSVKEPSLDPYAMKEANLGPDSDLHVKNVRLTGITLEGLANAIAPAPGIVFTPGVRAEVRLGTLPDGTAIRLPGKGGETKHVRNPITLTCGIEVEFDAGGTAKGQVTARIRDSDAHIELDTGGGTENSLNTLEVKARAVVLKIAPEHLDIDLKMSGQFGTLINSWLQGKDAKQRVVDELNKNILKEKEGIDKSLTENIRKLIASKLDD